MDSRPTVETGESSVYGRRLTAKEPKWCHQGDCSSSLDQQVQMTGPRQWLDMTA